MAVKSHLSHAGVSYVSLYSQDTNMLMSAHLRAARKWQAKKDNSTSASMGCTYIICLKCEGLCFDLCWKVYAEPLYLYYLYEIYTQISHKSVQVSHCRALMIINVIIANLVSQLLHQWHLFQLCQLWSVSILKQNKIDNIRFITWLLSAFNKWHKTEFWYNQICKAQKLREPLRLHVFFHISNIF